MCFLMFILWNKNIKIFVNNMWQLVNKSNVLQGATKKNQRKHSNPMMAYSYNSHHPIKPLHTLKSLAKKLSNSSSPPRFHAPFMASSIHLAPVHALTHNNDTCQAPATGVSNFYFFKKNGIWSWKPNFSHKTQK